MPGAAVFRLRELPSRWRQPGLQDRRGGLGRCEEAEQRESRVGLTGRTGERARERNSGWISAGIVPTKVTPGTDRLPDLLKADLASPRATTLATAAGRRSAYLPVLPAIWSAMPSFGNTWSRDRCRCRCPSTRWTLPQAASSASASTLPISGFAAPARTTMPICDRARSTLLSARTKPRGQVVGGPPSRITTSAASPRASCARNRLGESPIDGPRVVTRW